MPVNLISTEEEKNNGFKAFLPLFILSGVALISFVVGFNILLDRSNTPQPEITEQPDQQIIPLDHNNSETQPKKDQKDNPDPNSNSSEETKPPETIVKASPPQDNIDQTPAVTTPSLEVKPSPLPNSPSETNQNVSSPVPIVVLGTSNAELINKLGRPTSESKGYWNNSVALFYQDVIPNQADLSYVVDQDSREILQSEVSFNPSVDLSVMENTLNGLLKGNLPSPVKQALQQVYQGETDLRSFNLGNIKGMIQRNRKNKIYIAIWKADFH